VNCGDWGSFAAKSYENTRELTSLGRLIFAPRAFLQIFIKTSPITAWLSLWVICFMRNWL
jgi:hypothetical protein